MPCSRGDRDDAQRQNRPAPPWPPNGELAQDLLSWLNRLPEVQAILAAQPIDESNLTHWEQGGYLDKRNSRASGKSWASARSPAPPPPPPESLLTAATRT
jgi:hypothetical protein